jgi:hypothetical protein
MRLRSVAEVVIVELPLHPVALSLYEDGENVPAKITSYITRRTGSRNVPFFLTTGLDIVPANGFRDINHMNLRGSQIFSRWLANRVRRAERKGLIKFRTPSLLKSAPPAQD